MKNERKLDDTVDEASVKQQIGKSDVIIAT